MHCRWCQRGILNRPEARVVHPCAREASGLPQTATPGTRISRMRRIASQPADGPGDPVAISPTDADSSGRRTPESTTRINPPHSRDPHQGFDLSAQSQKKAGILLDGPQRPQCDAPCGKAEPWQRHDPVHRIPCASMDVQILGQSEPGLLAYGDRTATGVRP